MTAGGTLNWNGDAVKAAFQRACKAALGRFGLMVEGEAKRMLYPGHGVLTGTLRRSIHATAPDYAWSLDDVPPSEHSPERGYSEPEAKDEGGRLMIAIGSGLSYAMPVHQGWGSFGGYHFITKPFEQLKDQFPELLRRFLEQEGFRRG